MANNGQNAFLGSEGTNLLNAWLNTGMAKPYVMASTTWGSAPAPACGTAGAPQTLTATAGKRSVTLKWTAGSPTPTGGYRIYYDQAGKLLYRAGVAAGTLTYKDSNLTSRTAYSYRVTAWTDCNGNGTFDVGVDTESATSNIASATAL